jgi:hypothetical protein
VASLLEYPSSDGESGLFLREIGVLANEKKWRDAASCTEGHSEG